LFPFTGFQNEKPAIACDNRGFLKVSMFWLELQSHDASKTMSAHPIGHESLGLHYLQLDGVDVIHL